MAVLTSPQITELRKQAAADVPTVRWDKATINAAFQAIEDVFESGALQTAISNAINTATAPFVFTAPEKRMLVKFWLHSRFERGN